MEISKSSTLNDFKWFLIEKYQPKKIEFFDINNLKFHDETNLESLFKNDFIMEFEDIYTHFYVSKEIDYNMIYNKYLDNSFNGEVNKIWASPPRSPSPPIP